MIAELVPLDIRTIPPADANKIWEHVRKQDACFDDFSRADGALFCRRLIAPTSVVLEYADSGIVLFEGIVPRLSASIHFFVWDPQVHEAEMVEIGRTACRFAFDKFELHRITSLPPDFNGLAYRVATRVGFHYEGTIRETFLFKRKYHDVKILGLLRDDFRRRESERN